MTTIKQRLCVICYEDGETTQAVARYTTLDSEKYDVCEKHLKVIKEANLTYRMLRDDEQIEQDEI
ncbi:MAG: hypothetical protein WC365_08285 [Candidatus Babeliales bacterium]|jgi:hypothetical protein